MSDNPFWPILTTSSSGTVKATPENVAKLKACVRKETFMDAGWFCASGFDANGNFVISVDFQNESDYRRQVGLPSLHGDDAFGFSEYMNHRRRW